MNHEHIKAQCTSIKFLRGIISQIPQIQDFSLNGEMNF